MDPKDQPEMQAQQEVKDNQDRLDHVEIRDQLDNKVNFINLLLLSKFLLGVLIFYSLQFIY